MSFSLGHRAFRSDNTCYLKTRPQMPAQEEQSTTASELYTAERTSKIGTEFSPDLIEERNKANL